MQELLIPKKPEPQRLRVFPLVDGRVDRTRSLVVPVTAVDFFSMTTPWDELVEEFGPEQIEGKDQRLPR